MTTTVEHHFHPDSRLEVQSNPVLLSGVQALIRVVIDQMRRDRAAGARTAAFISGYPGSPLAGLDLELSRQKQLLQELDVRHLPALNEELAATAVYGSQAAQTFPDATYEGVLGVWYGKGPGLDRAADAIRHAQYVGTSRLGGAVAFVGDDPACKSSSIPSSSEQILADLGLAVIVPSSVADIVELGPHAIALSRLSGIWSGLRIVSDVADGVASVSGELVMPSIVEPEVEWRGQRYLATPRAIPTVPWALEAEAELREPRFEVAREYGHLNNLNRIVVDSPRPRVAIVAVGSLLHETLSALESLGCTKEQLADHGIRLCHVRMPHPMHEATIGAFVDGVERVIVIEEKRAFVETAIREALYGTTVHPVIVGKRDDQGRVLLPAHGTLHADELIGPLRNELSRFLPAQQLRPEAEKRLLPLLPAARAPYFCSGCPHNRSTKAPAGSVIGGGIGCHGMTMIMDPKVVGNIASATQMGGEGAQWIGIAPHVSTPHMFQNLGDGTYFHSGQLAIQAAVAAGVNITYKLLYNDAVAMTGGQKTSMSNALPVPHVAENLLRQGVKRVIVTTEDISRYRRTDLPRHVEVWDRRRLIEAQEALRAVEGVTVLIHDQRCAAENRRDRKRGRTASPSQRIFINERICEGCGDCSTVSNCLSVEPVGTEYGTKRRINQTTCNLDFSCIEGDCPSFISVKTKRQGGRSKGPGSAAPAPTESLAELLQGEPPEPRVSLSGEVLVRSPGIGGTGVVTASHVLGTAAMLDGLEVSGLDQTGLSQKAGAVVSDLRVSRGAAQRTSRAHHESVDVLLGFDVIAAAAAPTQDALVPGHTVAVLSTSRTPTGAMVANPWANYPDVSAFVEQLQRDLGSERVFCVDNHELLTELLGDASGANTVLLGIATQAGALPVRPALIEQAIELNGVAVEHNIAAFRVGRWWVADRDRLMASRTEPAAASPDPMPGGRAPATWFEAIPDAVRPLAEARASDLISYQNQRYGQRYAEVVSAVAVAEGAVAPGSVAFTDGVARGLYKLMAYKDEYEVARLALDPDERARLEAAFGPDVDFAWNLHPPVLRSLGYGRKLSLGRRSAPVFKILRSGRRLRGTRLDIFGYTEVRRLERRMIEEYIDAVLAVSRGLGADRLDEAVALAWLPDAVRGYERLKLMRGAEFLDSLNSARKAIERP